MTERGVRLTGSESLDVWRQYKTSGHFYRLTSGMDVSHTYQGRQWGHPSTYAAIHLVAEPDDSLVVELSAVLAQPPFCDPPDSLLRAIALAAVDELLCYHCTPFRGCRIKVDDIGWNEVTSSQVSVYMATRGALCDLRERGAWKLVE